MKIGKCYQCGSRVGRFTANGIFRADSNYRILRLWFKYPSKDEKNELGEIIKPSPLTDMPIPACAACCAAPNYKKILTLQNRNIGIIQFLKQEPKPQFVRFDGEVFSITQPEQEPESDIEEDLVSENDASESEQ